jgi:hypothetical protein
MDCYLKSGELKARLVLTYDKLQLAYLFRSGKEDAVPNAIGQTFDADFEDGCSWLSLRPTCFPVGQQHHDLKLLKVIATARNVELYLGANSSGRTYIKTLRGVPIDVDADLSLDLGGLKETRDDSSAQSNAKNYFAFELGPSDIDDVGGGGRGALRYLHLKFLSLRPVGCTRVTVALVQVQVQAEAHPANAVQPAARRSAAASGGAGGVAEISADALALLLGGGGGPPKAPAPAPAPAPTPTPAPASAAAAGMAPSGVAGSALLSSLMPALLAQIGSLLDAKLAPLHARLGAMEQQLAGLAGLGALGRQAGRGQAGGGGEVEGEGEMEGHADDDRPA